MEDLLLQHAMLNRSAKKDLGEVVEEGVDD